MISYVEFMNSRNLTSLEKIELQDCIESLKEKGFENIVKAFGF